MAIVIYHEHPVAKRIRIGSKRNNYSLKVAQVMFEPNKQTRIGDILVERGLISRQQLLQALDLQQARHLLSENKSPDGARGGIGEILIELGFITPEQLKKNLAHQSRIRKTTLAITLVAPLFTMACGGGGGGGGAAAPSTKPAQGTTSSVLVEAASSAQASSTPPQSPVSSSSSSSSSSKVQSSEKSSSSIKQSSSAAMSSTSSVGISGPVVLYWTAPTRRVNGNYLDINEVGGYELRYKMRDQSNFTYVKIPNGFTDSYYFDYLDGDYEFQIAAFDVNGVYSSFVPISPIN